jgi:FAD/FMN-containing dehydrogenase
MTLLDRLAAITGPAHVLTGAAAAPWAQDWMGKYPSTPLAVVRPSSTAQVAAIMSLAHETGTPVVPLSGNTGLPGGGQTDGGLILSLSRMNRIREIRPAARTAIVEAGVILSQMHDAAAEHDLIFPLTFGARGSAMIGGVLSTNAGGSNVLRYGNTRDLCLGVEVVLADGRVMNLMSELHKDNTGYSLRNLMIGAEGTLGVITAAVLKLFPRPRAYATAMVAVPQLTAALDLLNRMQAATGGAVEAFEYMPRAYIARHLTVIPGAREPFDAPHDVNILIELGATAPRDATPGPDGAVPIVDLLETTLGQMLDQGLVLDAVVARTDAQRREMWARRESAAELTRHVHPQVDTDVCLPLDRVDAFLTQVLSRVRTIDPDATDFCVAHLGDGNVHYTVMPTRPDRETDEAIRTAIEDVVQDMGGSFSAEHGIGIAKLGTMRRRKDPVALDVMRAVKRALDPAGILNPGKVIPD